MKTEQAQISINKFLTNYLDVKLDYSIKKWTHTKLNEILLEHDLEDCIVTTHIDREQLYNGDFVAVIDQVGKIKFYKNPRKVVSNTLVDSFCINYEINKKQKELNELYKLRVSLQEVGRLYKSINDLSTYIDGLKDLLIVVEEQEQKEEDEREKYRNKIKKKDRKNKKYNYNRKNNKRD